MAPNSGEQIINDGQQIPVSSTDHAKFVIIPQQTFTATGQLSQGYMQQLNGVAPQSEEDLINFNPVTVVFDGVVYTNIEGTINNNSLFYGDRTFTQYPFGIISIPGATSTDPQWVIGVTDTNEHTVEMFSGQDLYVYPSILDALKDDMDRIADTLDPNQTDPMKSTMDRIADAIEDGYTPSPTPAPSNDLTVAHVTFTNTTGELQTVCIPNYYEYEDEASTAADFQLSDTGPTSTVIVNIVLYKGTALGYIMNDSGDFLITTTGDVVYDEFSNITVTGDGTLTIELRHDQ